MNNEKGIIRLLIRAQITPLWVEKTVLSGSFSTVKMKTTKKK
ncbi:hypothetical protein [Crocosphaera chwakensis]|nr:hypothetical protein [Crocosphaera chwakensis]